MLDFSASAQRIARANTAIDAYGEIDTPVGIAGTAAGWADELEPIAKDSVR
jgi:hypothetical protein